MKKQKIVGLIDADLIGGGTRHPNLALLKLAGFLRDCDIHPVLITKPNSDLSDFRLIYISKVFTFTDDPVEKYNLKSKYPKCVFKKGGTGYYKTLTNVQFTPEIRTQFQKERNRDLARLEQDKQLLRLTGKQINMATQMPYYDLYNEYIEEVTGGDKKKKERYKDYLLYSIGFLTRGCVRRCPFCVNRLEGSVKIYSRLECFLDETRDDNGKLKRPYIYLWDDNILAYERNVKKNDLAEREKCFKDMIYLLDELNATGRPFQFRQGLDERMLADSIHGKEIADKLANSNYHGDFIFAFDNYPEKEKIIKALKIWTASNVKHHTTKFYLFCGFEMRADSDEKLLVDIIQLFLRIQILMRFKCLGYVMRHADYKNHPLANIYVQIARWCNQPQFYKKMSFWEFCYRNQTYWEEKTLHMKVNDEDKIISFNSFWKKHEMNEYYRGKKPEVGKNKLCLPICSVLDFLDKFEPYRDVLIALFSMKYSNPEIDLLKYDSDKCRIKDIINCRYNPK